MILKKDQIFRMIGSLKAIEKSYFKKISQKQLKPEHELIFLFNLISKYLKTNEASEAVNESILINKFVKKYPNKNYVATKSRLLQLLLEALREFDKKHSDLDKIFSYIAYAESLSRRNLFYDAKNILERAAKLAAELEQIELLLNIKSKIFLYDIVSRKYTKDFQENKIVQEIESDIKLLINKHKVDVASHQLLHFQKTIGIPRSVADLKRLDEIKSQDIFQFDEQPLLNTSLIDKAISLSGVHFLLGDVKAVIVICEKTIENYRPNKKLSKKLTKKYLSLFDSFLQACLLSVNLPLFEKNYPIFEQIKTYKTDNNNLKRSIDLYLKSIYAILSKKTELFKDLYPEFALLIKENFVHNFRKVSLAYYMVLGAFFNKNYEQSQKYINWLKNNRHLGIRFDIEIAIWSMESIILLETDELDLLEYQLRNFYDFLRSKERKFEMEAALLKLIKKGMNSTSERDFLKKAEKSWHNMKAIVANNPREKAFLNAFDVICWLESKLKNEDFKEVYFRNNGIGG
ncbi:MAG: hypothetical protein ACPG5B_15355 [Chitinophagales bacterium]